MLVVFMLLTLRIFVRVGVCGMSCSGLVDAFMVLVALLIVLVIRILLCLLCV